MSENELRRKIRESADKGLDYAIEGEYDKAIPLLTFAAENGHINSMANLGHLYELIKDFEKAFYWNKKAVDNGNSTGIYNLLVCYEFGKGCEPNGEETLKLADKLIACGRIDDGYFKKAMIIKKGIGNVPSDYYKAFQIALEGAEKVMKQTPVPTKGSPCESVLEVGIMYEFGHGVEADRKKAIKYYEYCALCYHDTGMYNYAQCLNYIDADDVESKKKALKIYKKLFTQAYSDAGYELVKFYTSDNKVVEKDEKKAAFILAKSLRQNNFYGHYDEAVEHYKKLCPEDFDNIMSGKYSRTLDSNE